ncbi:MAG: FMN-binding protein [Treponema sp.]|jgi:electron transport complex protein RnfG|nr:FMN-binding protein [Treponema sp.]
MKGMLKLGLVLACYAVAACVGLAFVYTATFKTIEEKTQADLKASLKELFPDADDFPGISGAFEPEAQSVQFKGKYEARKNGVLIGAVVEVSSASYGGAIKVLVGMGVDGRISRIKILEHKDTPGLGANAASPAYYVDRPTKKTFYGQFEGKSIEDRFEVKGDVTAITASTITSRAVTTAVKAAGDAAAKWLTAQGVFISAGGSR